MLSDSKFIENSLISNLYYLRTLREFCARVQLSLPSNYKEYIAEFELGYETDTLDNTGNIINLIISVGINVIAFVLFIIVVC